MSDNCADQVPPAPATTWERNSALVVNWLPYVTLAGSTTISLALEDQTWDERIGMLALVVASLGWVLQMYTLRSPAWRRRRSTMLVYFTGLLVLASLLILLCSPFFFVFMVTGFMHAFVLRPMPLILLGIFATSVLINTLPGGLPLDLDAESLAFVGTIVAIQTAAIGLGTIAGEKMSKLSEDRRRAVDELETAVKENAALHAQLLVQAREAGMLDERQRMAGEIHDTLAQGLTGIVTQLEAVSQAKDAPGERQRHFDNAIRLARDSLAEARRSVRELQPEQLEAARLPEALADVVRKWTALHLVPVEISTTGDAQPLHAEVEVALLRTAQEALANVAKHAGASRVGLTLSYMGDVVTLDVRDDGVGFDPSNGVARADRAERDGGFGLIGMRQRANRLAGTVEVESEFGGGTAVSVRLPAIPREVARA